MASLVQRLVAMYSTSIGTMVGRFLQFYEITLATTNIEDILCGGLVIIYNSCVIKITKSFQGDILASKTQFHV